MLHDFCNKQNKVGYAFNWLKNRSSNDGKFTRMATFFEVADSKRGTPTNASNCYLAILKQKLPIVFEDI